mmetsp:Transcript_4120/g.9689  ORF Transcript_4120/g.9689 Transcript_4120/m.9689 type:complete len:300 (-) Transcript_4120:1290-2189(-)
MHAGLPPHRDVHSLEGKRTAKPQLVGEHAGDLLILLVQLWSIRLRGCFWFFLRRRFGLRPKIELLHRDAPSVLQQHPNPSQSILLLACRRLIRNQCRGFRLGVHQGHSETRGMLIFDGDRNIVHAWSQGGRDVFGDISSNVPFFGRIYSKDLSAIRRHDQLGRPDLRGDVAVNLHAPAEDALILFSPSLQIRQVQIEGHGRSHEHMLSQDAGWLDNRIERIHVPEAAEWAPEVLKSPGVLGGLQVKVSEAVRTLEHSGRQHANVPYVAFLGERPGAKLVPESDTSFEANAKRKVPQVHI